MLNFQRRSLLGLFTIAVLGAHAACSGGQSLGDNHAGLSDDGGLDANLDASRDSAPTSDTGGETAVSHGPKIFISATGHVGDFADDAELAGTTVIEKADALCNKDSNKPDTGTYKALFVDGVNRSANPAIDWVLQPSTTYYASYGDLVIGTTTTAAIFDAEFKPLTNPIGTTPPRADQPEVLDQVWTGIGNNVDFSTGNTCGGWTGGDPDGGAGGASGARGYSGATDGGAFYSIGDYGCTFFELYLYCVEQP